MKQVKCARFFIFTLLAALVLSVSVLADMGPKPQLIVKVKNAPDEPYYLDLLAEGEYDPENGYDGIEWSYRGGEAAALDQELLAFLRENVPQGWHACTAQGGTGAPMWGDLTPTNEKGGTKHHVFGYHGVPETYRIIIVTKSGTVWVSDTLERKVLQSSATVNWKDSGQARVSAPPVFTGYVLQFLATLVPTILIEGVILLLFGFRWKENRKVFLLTNLITQGALAVYIAATTMQHGVSGWSLFFLAPIEVVILIAEAAIYAKALKGRGKGRAISYGAVANLSSFVLGYYLMDPVWRFIVSIS